MPQHTDAIVVGAGVAGMVAAMAMAMAMAMALALADAGRSVCIVEQEGENSVGGRAH